MRYRGYVIDPGYFQTGVEQRPEGGLSSRSGSLDLDFDFFHPLVGCLLGCIGNRVLSGEWCRFPGSLKTQHAGATPGNHVSLLIGNRDDGIVEGRVDMYDTFGNILFNLAF